MEEEDHEKTETDIPHFIAHVPVPSQKEVGWSVESVQELEEIAVWKKIL